ncbi:RpiB/LacA/LacB family sugar-phosphate isomerase [Sphaerochaeta halotolerans]|jgi:ribose 5-phosphate isomerase B|uniref:RpiB/LacA/LacB family sugar-phosphate isomerase n=1 Tax=Sphaerochaeta halotolerans TaxID=2293840 RepID=UPI00136FB187|nr:RpiB/LacA/LacB family sugar-phosphate isomerase [Sphaerochaeta halotolerans]MDK2859057.1 ribose 5-phosphate isomerase [Sphaerochaeta sp.]MDN5332775.1 ribose 5-phosphate isomerase [Sphaerochaeta sp.]MXI85203.1 RpiB/LacA/LacB family sugar-phosphate isomerase [Sphaerochaeta halotolerans]
MNIAIASDLSGFPLKAEITKHLQEQGYEVLDFGIESAENPQPYFIQAPKVAGAIQEGKAEKGILICGTGQGMAIVANKYKGIYACVVDSIFSAERAKIVNNANVITMGGWITAPFLGIQIVDAWLAMAFTQKMEFKKDFLSNAFKQVQAIEEENFL